MNYFLKEPKTSEILGPFAVEEINAKLADGTLDSTWVASADLGETIEQMQRARASDWIRLWRLNGINGVKPPDVPIDPERLRLGKTLRTILRVGCAILFIPYLILPVVASIHSKGSWLNALFMGAPVYLLFCLFTTFVQQRSDNLRAWGGIAHAWLIAFLIRCLYVAEPDTQVILMGTSIGMAVLWWYRYRLLPVND